MWDSDRSVSCLPRLHRLLALTSSTAERTGTGPEASGYALRWRANALYLRTCIPASASAARRATASVTLSLKLSLSVRLIRRRALFYLCWDWSVWCRFWLCSAYWHHQNSGNSSQVWKCIIRMSILISNVFINS